MYHLLCAFIHIISFNHHQGVIPVSQVALVVKDSPDKAGDMRHWFDPWVMKIPLKKAWQPWTEEPGRLWSIGLQRVSYKTEATYDMHTKSN